MTALLINLLCFCLAAGTAVAEPWPDKPPVIGRLEMPQAYWDLTRQAARRHGVSPYVIQGFMAIESRFQPRATSGGGRCVGLMQLNREVAKGLGVDPWDPGENIDGGARILSRLMKRYQGDLKRVARAYHGPGCPPAYVREVVRAVRQASRQGAAYEAAQRHPVVSRLRTR
jgi:soluble lytic murein transglycosylase-like protein